jgi:ribosomal protein S18 acetylase RimI-like enzyme
MRHLHDATCVPASSADAQRMLAHFAIRQLVLSDEPHVAQLFKRLEPWARLDRFGHEMSDSALEAYAREALASSPAVFGALIDDQLAGVAEITRFAGDETAMLAFAVDAQWRRQGIGCRLLLAALAWTTERGLSCVQLQCARTNWAVRQIAQKANARVSLTAGQFLAQFDSNSRAAFMTAQART